MIKHRLAMVLTVASMVLGATATAALASDQSTKDDNGWGCAAEVGLPDGHCISPGTWKNLARTAENGGTFQLLVFDANGDFVTAELATFDADADGRPCPHDDGATDGTFWHFANGIYVCHHRSH
ncbi:MAG: hypothetical protein KY461_01580 [Actinobacteria bacterium]|nr:hypothetical protein [Actinomycetota bacterium]